MTKVFLFLSLCSVALILNVKWGGEREGAVKSDDCREQIPIQEGSFAAFNKTFDCRYEKSKSGKIMSGSCTAVEVDGNGTCKASYSYEKTPWLNCGPRGRLKDDDQCYSCPAHSTMIDDRCYLDAGFHWSSRVDQPKTAIPDEPPPGTIPVPADGGRQ
jgi:hypothetical protein